MGVVGGICRLGRWAGCLGGYVASASPAAEPGICRIYHTEPPVVDKSVDNCKRSRVRFARGHFRQSIPILT